LQLINLKQRRRGNRSKLVYVSAQLVGDLRRLTSDARIPSTGYLFGGRRHADAVSRQYAWRLVDRYARPPASSCRRRMVGCRRRRRATSATVPPSTRCARACR
jgi:hypothetical protein